MAQFRDFQCPGSSGNLPGKPLRLVLDFQDTTLVSRSFDVPVNLGPIARWRAGQHSPSVTRIVLELTEPVAPCLWRNGPADMYCPSSRDRGGGRRLPAGPAGSRG